MEKQESHLTEDEYCCACEYDIACMNEKIEIAIQKKVEEVINEIEKQDIVKDKVGSFYDGYICFKDQILYYLKNK